jgi:hypothetical protein
MSAKSILSFGIFFWIWHSLSVWIFILNLIMERMSLSKSTGEGRGSKEQQQFEEIQRAVEEGGAVDEQVCIPIYAVLCASSAMLEHDQK